MNPKDCPRKLKKGRSNSQTLLKKSSVTAKKPSVWNCTVIALEKINIVMKIVIAMAATTLRNMNLKGTLQYYPSLRGTQKHSSQKLKIRSTQKAVIAKNQGVKKNIVSAFRLDLSVDSIANAKNAKIADRAIKVER